MDHYQHLVIKSLMNKGGSSSESYVYQLLSGNVSESLHSVEQAWNYLDKPLQEMLVEILNEIGGLNLSGVEDDQLIAEIKEHMARKSGRAYFFETYSHKQIAEMSDEDYENGIESFIEDKRKLLENR